MYLYGYEMPGSYVDDHEVYTLVPSLCEDLNLLWSDGSHAVNFKFD